MINEILVYSQNLKVNTIIKPKDPLRHSEYKIRKKKESIGKWKKANKSRLKA